MIATLDNVSELPNMEKEEVECALCGERTDFSESKFYTDSKRQCNVCSSSAKRMSCMQFMGHLFSNSRMY